MDTIAFIYNLFPVSLIKFKLKIFKNIIIDL